jgi:hypothetical protein
MALKANQVPCQRHRLSPFFSAAAYPMVAARGVNHPRMMVSDIDGSWRRQKKYPDMSLKFYFLRVKRGFATGSIALVLRSCISAPKVSLTKTKEDRAWR